MKKLVLVVICMFLFCVAYAQIFKWTDSQGVVHFSDQPHPGAKQLNIPDTQSSTPPASQSGSAPVQDEQKTEQSSSGEDKYRKLVIIQPINDATIRNNQGYIVVVVEMEPDLAGGDKLQMIFDGTPLGEPQSSTLFQLNGINRGTHTIAIQIIKQDGTTLLTSDIITIHLHRPRVGMVKRT